MPFSQLGLYSSLVRATEALGYTAPTPIQEKAIPLVLAGKDLVASAPTGTGKTASFALPILHRIGSHRATGPRVLVLEPTRELAAQVDESFRQLGQFTDAKSVVLHGGVNVGPQRNALRAGPDIVVATTGRLLDHLDSKNLKLDLVEVLVLDEVDRMLDMGFISDVKQIIRLCPKERQTLLFSATMPPKLQEIASFALRSPERIEIGRTDAVTDTVRHALHPVKLTQKFDLLLALLAHAEFKSVIIFTRTKRAADQIGHHLRVANHSVALLHADRSQSERTAALENFKSGRQAIMVATDVAARGLDIAGVSHVINFDVPQQPEDYVHRLGRTGRAQASGAAVTLASPEEAADVQAIEKFLGHPIPQRALPDFPYATGAMPVIDTSKPQSTSLRPVGRQRLGAGGQAKGTPGRNQAKDPSRPAHGGGNPTRHPKGKPGAHWRKSGGW